MSRFFVSLSLFSFSFSGTLAIGTIPSPSLWLLNGQPVTAGNKIVPILSFLYVLVSKDLASMKKSSVYGLTSSWCCSLSFPLSHVHFIILTITLFVIIFLAAKCCPLSLKSLMAFLHGDETALSLQALRQYCTFNHSRE